MWMYVGIIVGEMAVLLVGGACYVAFVYDAAMCKDPRVVSLAF